VVPRTVSDAVRSRVTNAGDQDWLDQLPALIAGLERDWEIRVGRSYDGGSEAFVADATLDDGSEGVLKVFIPRLDDSARHEIAVLRLANGDGCALLLRSDPSRLAMLVERLGPTLDQSGLPPLDRRRILVARAQRLWRITPDVPLPTGAEKGRWLIDFITRNWEQLGHPCSEGAVAYAIECAERRIGAHDDARAVLVHGDIHEWNALHAGDGYKLIDPDGLLAEPEYDLGVIMREDPIDSADPRASARWLARHTGLDETATWEWASVERLSTGLICARLKYEPTATNLLARAELAAQLATKIKPEA
jgi:streptomycin 6-kinase